MTMIIMVVVHLSNFLFISTFHSLQSFHSTPAGGNRDKWIMTASTRLENVKWKSNLKCTIQ